MNEQAEYSIINEFSNVSLGLISAWTLRVADFPLRSFKMCLFFTFIPQNNAGKEDDDLVPSRPVSSVLSGFSKYFSPRNSISILNAKEDVGRHKHSIGERGLEDIDGWLKNGAGEEKIEIGYVVDEKSSERTIGLEEKVEERKLRLNEAKANFQKSMDQLNKELVLIKEL